MSAEMKLLSIAICYLQCRVRDEYARKTIVSNSSICASLDHQVSREHHVLQLCGDPGFLTKRGAAQGVEVASTLC